jgi:hypothetical protein
MDRSSTLGEDFGSDWKNRNKAKETRQFGESETTVLGRIFYA